MKWQRIRQPQDADTAAEAAVRIDDDVDSHRSSRAGTSVSRQPRFPTPAVEDNDEAEEDEAPQQRRPRWSKRNILDKAMDKKLGRGSKDAQGATSCSSSSTNVHASSSASADSPEPSSSASQRHGSMFDQPESSSDEFSNLDAEEVARLPQRRSRWSRSARSSVSTQNDEQAAAAQPAAMADEYSNLDAEEVARLPQTKPRWSRSARSSVNTQNNEPAAAEQRASVSDDFSNLDAEEVARLPQRRASRWSSRDHSSGETEGNQPAAGAVAPNRSERQAGAGGQVAAVQNPFAKLELGPNAKMAPSAFFQAQEIKQMRNNRKAFANRNVLNRDGPNAQLWTIPEDREA